jgi:hypothetical protein
VKHPISAPPVPQRFSRSDTGHGTVCFREQVSHVWCGQNSTSSPHCTSLYGRTVQAVYRRHAWGRYLTGT